MIKAVFFDLYETLITEWDNGRKKYLKELPDIGMEEALFKIEWSKRREERMNGTFPDFTACVKDIFIKNEVEANDHLIDLRLKERIKAKRTAFENVDQHILKMLAELKDHGMKVGLISNCAAEEIAAWQESPIAAFMDEVIFSYQTGYAKPDVEIYELACRKMGVETTESIFIGDNGSDELNGAKKAGLHPFHAKWFNKHWDSERSSDFRAINDPNEIMELIKSSR
ncbi:HAD family hydrolase [Falsibacillus pallidus]|uniref:HAD family hydrolase n=1 Tax=Falsibacillus pallidus TaxID=493781 RepID=UPI003D993A4C